MSRIMCNFSVAVFFYYFEVFHRRRKVKFHLAIVFWMPLSLFLPFHVSGLAGICQKGKKKVSKWLEKSLAENVPKLHLWAPQICRSAQGH